MTFQVGDRVRCIDPGKQNGLVKGKTYTVKGFHRHTSYLIRVEDDDDRGYLAYNHRFERWITPQDVVNTFLVFAQAACKQRELRVGDKVRLITGDVPYTIWAINPDGNWAWVRSLSIAALPEGAIISLHKLVLTE